MYRSYNPTSTRARAPINSLPVELLSYIFILGTQSVADSGYPDVDQSQQWSPPFNTESIGTPLVLSSVSRHWRGVAMNTPTLWTNLCVTVEMIGKSGILNTNHLISYLALSRNYPLHILIDARDRDWDFSEPEIPSDYEFNTYTPPFTPAHMSTVVNLLLPHLARWQSIDILTDSWAPMYVALRHMNPRITALGAPLLESMTLMRCNDFVSYAPDFQPRDMKDPAFLSCEQPANIFPRLRHLTLRGVHVDWVSLACVLNASGGLRTLELSSHCSEVRPSLHEFHHLLTSTPSLRKLVVNGSGPSMPDDMDIVGDGPVALPDLQDITLGYRSLLDGQSILELIDAPNTKTLTLEDSTHPADPEEVDADGLLSYISTSENTSADAACPQHKKWNGDRQAMFSQLEQLTLRRIKASAPPLRTLFGSLQNLRRLEMIGMSMDGVRTLVPVPTPVVQSSPRSSPAAQKPLCPCPYLESLCLRGVDGMQVPDMHFLGTELSVARGKQGALALREVEVYVKKMVVACHGEEVDLVDAVAQASAIGAFSGETGTVVHVYREGEGEEDEDEMECDAREDPWRAGGVFNDPSFDAYYASRGVFVR